MARMLVGIAILVIVFALSAWVLAPYTAYPSINDIDIDLVTEEADNLFSQCTEEEGPDGSLSGLIRVEPSQSPYLFGLYDRGRNMAKFHIICSDVLHIPMWRDWWNYQSGLYVLRKGHAMPGHLSSSTKKIAGRVYWWSDDAETAWY